MTTPDDRRLDALDDDRVVTDDDRVFTEPDTDRTDRTDAGLDNRSTDDTLNERTTGDALDDRPRGDALDDRATTTDRTPSDRGETQDLSEQPLVNPDAVVDFRARWEVIQQGFVDDPRNAVSEADKLVDDLLKRLSDTFDQQHQDLEKQWSDGEPNTEDLRSALQRYRAFFQRLLTL